MEKNIILVGLGPHARRIYYPLLEKYAGQHAVKLALVVDLADQEDVIRRYSLWPRSATGMPVFAGRKIETEGRWTRAFCRSWTALRPKSELTG